MENLNNFKMEEVDCIMTASTEWAKENGERCAIIITCDETDNIRTLVYGNGFNISTMLASALDGNDHAVEEVFTLAQKMRLLRKLLDK